MKVAICDDESIFLKQVECLLKEIPEITEINSYNDISTLFLNLSDKKYDLVLMDIDWNDNEETGVQYAARINEQCPNIQVIFITAYNDRFSECIFFEKVNLCGYLVKPIKLQKLQFLVNKALENEKKRREEYIVVQYRGVTETIPFSDIMYLESKAHQLYISTLTQQIQVYKKLDDYESILNKTFVRVHKSFMVNMNYIKRIERVALTLKNGDVLPVSKTKYQLARDKFFKYMSEQL